jgi:hypothetical protein
LLPGHLRHYTEPYQQRFQGDKHFFEAIASLVVTFSLTHSGFLKTFNPIHPIMPAIPHSHLRHSSDTSKTYQTHLSNISDTSQLTGHSFISRMGYTRFWSSILYSILYWTKICKTILYSILILYLINTKQLLQRTNPQGRKLVTKWHARLSFNLVESYESHNFVLSLNKMNNLNI